MPKPLTVLCLSFRTPPAVRPQAILIGKMIPEWIRQGIQPVIITYTTNGGTWDIDAPVYPIAPPRSIPLLSRVPILRNAIEYVALNLIARHIARIAKHHHVDLIFSFANPQESNIIGAMVRRITKIPYVSHFSDPYADEFLASRNKIAAKIARMQERFVINTSDAVVFVDDAPRDIIMKKYPAAWKQKTAVVPHCYDPADYPSACPHKNSVFTLSYIGTFYEKRNPEILLQLASRLRDELGADGPSFHFQFVGAAQSYGGYSIERLTDMIRDAHLEEIIHLIPPVDYKKSLEYMVCSDALVVFDANIANSPFLPSKVIDYAGSGTPIVAITPDNSPTDRVLTRLGHASFTYDELPRLVTHLADMIRTGHRPTIDLNAAADYHVSATTAKLRSLFEHVL